MKYRAFVERAHAIWGQVPATYREGVDGIVVKREAETHPDHDDYFTLGTCSTEPYPSGYGGPDSTRSILTLFYGSFAQIAESDPDFSWEEELWETITHELRHHLEFMVEDDALERVDHAMEQAHRRDEGLDFDPWYFQSGVEVAPGVYEAERELFIEQRWSPSQFDATERLEFDFAGKRWSIARPGELGDIHYVWITGLDSDDVSLQLVLVRDQSIWERLGRLIKRAPLDLIESEAEAVALDDSSIEGLGRPNGGERPIDRPRGGDADGSDA